MRVRLTATILTLVASTAIGCGMAFERDWRAAKRDGIPEDHLAGLWEGTWRSHHNDHNGRLRAIITHCDQCGRYHAHYHATFAGVIPYAYETTHTAVTHDGHTCFRGDEDLGHLAGGHYYYNGSADGCSFEARFRADKDHGVFQMTRVRGR